MLRWMLQLRTRGHELSLLCRPADVEAFTMHVALFTMAAAVAQELRSVLQSLIMLVFYFKFRQAILTSGADLMNGSSKNMYLSFLTSSRIVTMSPHGCGQCPMSLSSKIRVIC